MSEESQEHAERRCPPASYRDRRPAHEGARRARTAVSYTHTEWAEIVVAAAREQRKPGAWVAQVAHEAAVRGQRGALASRSEVVSLVREMAQCRQALVSLGNRLNAVARATAASVSPEAHRAARALLGVVADQIRDVDRTMDAARARLRS
ncbi:hypothetical protein GCM10022247_34810 [Allokutzneria multivorans]|uniref:Mobilization protein MobC n=1 Tax=Allokutzneria multivorans TaxID=1142134 RepID=A0ABP7SCA8_9PSEU